MNIEEYRAMVAQQKAQAEENPNAQTQQVSNEPVLQSDTQTQQAESTPQAEGTQATTQTEPSTEPQKFIVDGQELTLDELQRGYLRQSDYTRKTQEISRQARELETARQFMGQLKQNPEIASQLGFDEQQQYTQELEQNYYDLLVEQEINQLSTKYADFEASEVLNFALTNKLENLEHAYLLNKQLAPKQLNTQQYTTPAPVDVEALKQQIRNEILAEQNTATIITSGGTAPTPQQGVQLSEAELRVAKAMKLTPEQYVAFR